MTATPAWTPIPKDRTTFRSFGGVPDQGEGAYPYHVRFPAGTASTPDAACDAAQSGYELFRYAATGDPNTPYLWQGPLTGPLQREPGGIYVTTEPYQRVMGLAFDGMFGGAILENSSDANAISQTVFLHQSYCYDGGPELGFYRRLLAPGSVEEASTLYLYYSTKTNCTGFAAAPLNSPGGVVRNQTSCLLRGTTDQWDSQEFAQTAIPIPSGRNSRGRWNYRYAVWLTGPASLHIEVRDPFNSAVVWSGNHAIAPFFAEYATSMWRGTFWSFVTFGIQKALARDVDYHALGDITADPADVPIAAARSTAVLQAPVPPALS